MRSIVDRSNRGFVHVTGPDAFSFLQALVSADLDPLGDGDSASSLLLQPQGKLDVAFRLVRVGDEAWLDTDPGLALQLAASLNKFKIRVKAEVVDRSDEFGMLTFVEGDAPAHEGVIVVPTALGVDVIGPVDAIAAVRDASDAPVLDGDAWEAFRIERGIPLQPVDIDDRTIPQEAELEVDAVSFTKGCFIGQELVCRIDSRGHVNRFLRRLVDVQGARPAVGTEIVADDKVVGEITSVTPEPFPCAALGYVRREVDPGTTVALRTPGDTSPSPSTSTATATVATLHP